MRGARKDDQYKKTGIVGDNGTGKSTVLLDLIGESYDPSIHRVLILCQTNPKAYKGITRLKTYDDLKRFESGIALFWDYEIQAEQMLVKLAEVYNEGQKNMELHPRNYSIHYLHNGALVLDDCSNYISANPPKIVMQFLGNYRMYYIDLFFIAHSLTDFPSALRRRMNYFILFKTLENLNERDLKSFRYPNHVNIYKAWSQVMKDPNRFAKLPVKTGTS